MKSQKGGDGCSNLIKYFIEYIMSILNNEKIDKKLNLNHILISLRQSKDFNSLKTEIEKKELLNNSFRQKISVLEIDSCDKYDEVKKDLEKFLLFAFRKIQLVNNISSRGSAIGRRNSSRSGNAGYHSANSYYPILNQQGYVSGSDPLYDSAASSLNEQGYVKGSTVPEYESPYAYLLGSTVPEYESSNAYLKNPNVIKYFNDLQEKYGITITSPRTGENPTTYREL